MGKIYKLNNLKIFLIFTVVFCHLVTRFPSTKQLYLFFLSFNMPVFMFISGFLSNKKWKNNLISLWLFIIFQIIYYFVETRFLGENYTFNFTTPRYVLWYIYCVVIYRFIILALNPESVLQKCIVIPLTFVLALLAGYDDTMGYTMQMSRLFTFAPFFFTGFYLSKSKRFISFLKEENLTITIRIVMKLMAILMIIILAYFVMEIPLTRNMVKGCYSYNNGRFTVYDRMGVIALGFIFGVLLIVIMPKSKLFFIDQLGSNTLTIYLLHPFIVRRLIYKNFFIYSPRVNVLLSIAIALCICIVLGNNLFNKLFRKITLIDFMKKNEKRNR